MADRYFKKEADKFSIGNSDVVFKYDFTTHKIEDLETRFTECDANGKELKVVKKATKKTTKKAGK